MSSFEYQDKHYELKITRAGIREAESQGLTISNLGEKPQSAIAYLFFAALYGTYKMNPTKTTIMLDELLDDEVVKFDELFAELVEGYNKLFGLGESAE